MNVLRHPAFAELSGEDRLAVALAIFGAAPALGPLDGEGVAVFAMEVAAGALVDLGRIDPEVVASIGTEGEPPTADALAITLTTILTTVAEDADVDE